MEKRKLNEAPKEALEKKTKESKKLKKEVVPILGKTKFRRRAIEDAKSICYSDKETYSRISIIGTIPMSLNYSTSFLTFPQLSSSQRRWRKAL